MFAHLLYRASQVFADGLGEQPKPLCVLLTRALFITRQIASALARASEIGIVHRDLKPENIMLVQREGHSDFVKVLDFGLAQVPRQIVEDPSDKGVTASSPKLTKLGDIFGTPLYMAPEQSIGAHTDVRTDLYSLGIILYEMLAGKRPFAGKSTLVLMQQHLTMRPPAISECAPTVKVPKEVEALVQRLLAKNPEDRIQRPEDLLAEIDGIAAAYQLFWPNASKSLAGLSPVQESTASQRLSSISAVASSSRIGTDSPLQSAKSLAWSKIEETFLSWRQNLGGPLRRVPRWLGICGLVLAIALPIGLTMRARRHQDSEIPQNVISATAPWPSMEGPLAPQSALDTATAKGLEAMATLGSRYPADPRIQHALLRNYTSQHRHAEAMRVIAKLATLDPGAGTDSEVIRGIVAAVQGDPDSVEATAILLEQDLGADGVDLLYDLTVKQTGARWKPRLNHSLTKPEVLAKASPAARLALELRAAKFCEAKRALLPRVQKEGDRRALIQLRSLAQTQGCGIFSLQDCWPCLRKTRALQDAMTALESRTKESGQP